ncbi:putative yir3 protein [Plasmodium yoelii yoelii]|uniref:Yir3 protein n=1 Tax=Plasmodium yoelii yoelii TaxID=73239 RepID=Q7RBJ2_PLAYO|nr:putative yir3 protein [Plasmodium yoelii yoelii]
MYNYIFFKFIIKCNKFFALRNWFPDQLSRDGNYQFKSYNNHSFCTNINCETDIDKINAGCLWLFKAIFFDSYSFKTYAKNNINMVEYIMIWLSYILSLKKDNSIKNLKEFYDQYISNDKEYTSPISGVEAYYSSYKDLMDKKNGLMSIGIKDISKFYDAFKLLCEICTEIDASTSNCSNYLQKAKEFAKKYDDLNENYNNTKGSPYNQVLSTLSNDYNNIKNKCNHFPSLPTFSRRSVIKNTLISITFIFVAISICLGIAYKYSLFGFRKRFQKQKLREKLKNVKKRMNH